MGTSPVDNSFQHLNTIQNQILGNTKRLASGKKQTADDPAGLAQADRLDVQSRGLSQALRNVDSARGVIETAASATGEVHESITKVKELTLQFKQANDTDKEIIREQIQSELENIDRAANQKGPDGKQLLNNNNSLEIQAGDESSDVVFVNGADLTTEGINLEGFDPADADALDKLDAAGQTVARAEARLGTAEKRLDFVSSNVANRVQALESARSRIEDVDYAQELAEKTKLEILSRQGIAVQAQANLNLGALQSILKPR